MIRMEHPEHGWTHAYGPEEQRRLEAQGWRVEQPQESPEPVAESAVIELARKRGRPRKVA